LYCVFTSTKTKQINTFTEDGSPNGQKPVAQYAWGTYVVRLRQSSGEETLNVSIDIPHPYNDWGTYPQGTLIFIESDARSMYLAGAHRNARTDTSKCDAGTSTKTYKTSDASHEYQHPLTYTTLGFRNHWKPNEGGTKKYAVIQIHGKGKQTCTKSAIFIADGRADASGNKKAPGPDSKAVALRTNLKSTLAGEELNGGIHTVDETNSIDSVTADTNKCYLAATRNIQMKIAQTFKNVQPTEENICKFATNNNAESWNTSINNRFLQLEQNPTVRYGENWKKYAKTIGKAIKATYANEAAYKEQRSS